MFGMIVSHGFYPAKMVHSWLTQIIRIVDMNHFFS